MPRFPAAAVLMAVALAACSPTFNWRDVRVEPTGLKAMLPCKPDKGSRRVPMGGREVELAVTGCEAGGATFAILHADLGDPGRAGEVLAQWQRASLATMQATASTTAPFAPAGATPVAGAGRVSAQGRQPGGAAVRTEAAYFARGTRVFQAVVVAPQLPAEVLQPFFDGLAFE